MWKMDSKGAGRWVGDANLGKQRWRPGLREKHWGQKEIDGLQSNLLKRFIILVN